jgi:hypothetical protein
MLDVPHFTYLGIKHAADEQELEALAAEATTKTRVSLEWGQTKQEEFE